jgi:EAL domain-containing protein (putative c-di-GMP-specific phosphodiesterase class I)
LGCELAQGYGIARPMPVAEVSGWIARWDRDQQASLRAGLISTPN